LNIKKTHKQLWVFLFQNILIMMTEQQSKDPLHGKTLEMIVTHLVDTYGWEDLGQRINIKCFNIDPSIKSSLTFLRKTSWAREKVESLYLYSLRKKH
jgi:uncharacterized protein (DUF2132 family)